MSEWKQQSIKRRDERKCKSPEQLRPRKKKVDKKPFVVMRKLKEGEECWLSKSGEWEKYGRYSKRKDAEQAINSIKDNWYSNQFDYRIDDA